MAELLTSARVGDVREWLNPAFLEGQARYFGASTLAEYFSRIRSACPDGVFGQKMTIWFYEAFAREVRLEDHFDFSAPCVVLFRENIVEQAVSLCFAANRNVFHGKDAAVALADVAYNAADIRQCIEGFVGEEERLRSFVEQHRSRVRYLSYEQLACAPTELVLEAIGRLVGVQPALDSASSAHRKLGDDANRAQAQRFVEEHPEHIVYVMRRRQCGCSTQRRIGRSSRGRRGGLGDAPTAPNHVGNLSGRHGCPVAVPMLGRRERVVAEILVEINYCEAAVLRRASKLR